jgi:hypothetical protein
MQKQHDLILFLAVGVMALVALLRPVLVWSVALVITLALASRHRHQAPPHPGLDVASPVAPVPTVAPRPHPLFALAEDLQMMPTRHLRALAGIRSKAQRKVVLIEQLLALPV